MSGRDDQPNNSSNRNPSHQNRRDLNHQNRRDLGQFWQSSPAMEPTRLQPVRPLRPPVGAPSANAAASRENWWQRLLGGSRRQRNRSGRLASKSSSQSSQTTQAGARRGSANALSLPDLSRTGNTPSNARGVGNQPLPSRWQQRLNRNTTVNDRRDRPTLALRRPTPTSSTLTALTPQRNGNSGSSRPTRGRDGAAATRRQQKDLQPRRKSVGAALYAARILILSLGIGVLAGTILSAWDPASRNLDVSKQPTKQAAIKGATSEAKDTTEATLQLGPEITALKPAVQELLAKTPDLQAGVFFLDLDNNAYLDLNGSAVFAAASTIKVPVLVAFFQDVDAGKIRLDEKLTMRKELMASGSGEMQYQAPGTQYTALETATKMIIISDNTATNMMIARLGGITALNQRFRSWGLTATAINNVLPDLEGTNTTSAKDLSFLMMRISRGDLITMKSRDRMLDIMRQTVTDSLLPRGLGEGAQIAHKTGDIGTYLGDVGLIDVPNGKRYVGMVLVKRPHNDDRAGELIRQVSRLTYQFFASNNSTNPAPTNSPAATSGPPPSATDRGTL